MRKFLGLIGRFRGDQRGNIAVIFTLALLPILSAVGCAIDYSRATQLRSKLLAAADAASVGSIAKTSPAFIAAGAMTVDGPIPAGVTDATNIFNANMSGVTGFTLNSMTPVVTKAGASAFFGTPVTSMLVASGIDTVLVTGATTSGCVRASVVDAVQHGFATFVVTDCVADRAVAPHEANLFDMTAKYADPLTLEEVVGYLKQLPGAAVR